MIYKLYKNRFVSFMTDEEIMSNGRRTDLYDLPFDLLELIGSYTKPKPATRTYPLLTINGKPIIDRRFDVNNKTLQPFATNLSCVSPSNQCTLLTNRITHTLTNGKSSNGTWKLLPSTEPLLLEADMVIKIGLEFNEDNKPVFLSRYDHRSCVRIVSVTEGSIKWEHTCMDKRKSVETSGHEKDVSFGFKRTNADEHPSLLPAETWRDKADPSGSACNIVREEGKWMLYPVTGQIWVRIPDNEELTLKEGDVVRFGFTNRIHIGMYDVKAILSLANDMDDWATVHGFNAWETDLGWRRGARRDLMKDLGFEFEDAVDDPYVDWREYPEEDSRKERERMEQLAEASSDDEDVE